MKWNVIGIILFAAVVLLFTQELEASSSTLAPTAQKQFFENLKKLCGRRFAGATEFPANADHPLVGKKLLMFLETCSTSEIRIPFQAGEDKSRIWILTLTERGLQLKHDHRHADGTPDKITMYGGWADASGNATSQSFPADPETAKLIPEAATNVWTLEINPERQEFTYSLERNKERRYKAVFHLRDVPQ